MFTIKHRRADGVELLYNAETIEVVSGKGQWDDGVYLDWPEGDPVPPDALHTPPRPAPKRVIAITTPYKLDLAGSAGQAAGLAAISYQPRIWIMNETGATVASYDL